MTIQSVGNQVVQRIKDAKKKLTLCRRGSPELTTPVSDNAASDAAAESQDDPQTSNEPVAAESQQEQGGSLQSPHEATPKTATPWIEVEITVGSIRNCHEKAKRAFCPISKRLETAGHRLLSYRARRAKASMSKKHTETLTNNGAAEWRGAFSQASERMWNSESNQGQLTRS
jgi:hypothetical protein